MKDQEQLPDDHWLRSLHSIMVFCPTAEDFLTWAKENNLLRDTQGTSSLVTTQAERDVFYSTYANNLSIVPIDMLLTKQLADTYSKNDGKKDYQLLRDAILGGDYDSAE